MLVKMECERPLGNFKALWRNGGGGCARWRASRALRAFAICAGRGPRPLPEARVRQRGESRPRRGGGGAVGWDARDGLPCRERESLRALRALRRWARASSGRRALTMTPSREPRTTMGILHRRHVSES